MRPTAQQAWAPPRGTPVPVLPAGSGREAAHQVRPPRTGAAWDTWLLAIPTTPFFLSALALLTAAALQSDIGFLLGLAWVFGGRFASLLVVALLAVWIGRTHWLMGRNIRRTHVELAWAMLATLTVLMHLLTWAVFFVS